MHWAIRTHPAESQPQLCMCVCVYSNYRKYAKTPHLHFTSFCQLDQWPSFIKVMPQPPPRSQESSQHHVKGNQCPLRSHWRSALNREPLIRGLIPYQYYGSKAVNLLMLCINQEELISTLMVSYWTLCPDEHRSSHAIGLIVSRHCVFISNTIFQPWISAWYQSDITHYRYTLSLLILSCGVLQKLYQVWLLKQRIIVSNSQ